MKQTLLCVNWKTRWHQTILYYRAKRCPSIHFRRLLGYHKPWSHLISCRPLLNRNLLIVWDMEQIYKRGPITAAITNHLCSTFIFFFLVSRVFEDQIHHCYLWLGCRPILLVRLVWQVQLRLNNFNHDSL
jgi:hypothetical protein